MSYMTVETTNLTGCSCFSFQCNEHDIPNGAVVGKGDLVDGETEIYQATNDYSNGLFLVANPAWTYENYTATSQNEENYVNVKGKPFKVYELLPNRKFKIGNVEEHEGFETKGFIKYDLSSGKYQDDEGQESGLKIVKIEETGFPYCVGSAGVSLADDEGNKYGKGVLDLRNTKYTIEYVAGTSGE